jgi:hypothetical protein
MLDRPQQTFGRHVYVASELGLSKAQLDSEYADYRARFGAPSES